MIAHVAASTVVALVAVAATLAMKRQRAAWRYAVLLAAVLRFAIPTAWLTNTAARVAPRVPARLTLPDALAPALLHPGAMLAATPAAHASTVLWPILWTMGAALAFGLWARRTLRPMPAVRPLAPEERDAFPDAPIRIVASGHVPGAHGFWRQSVILPDGLAQHLTAPEIRAIVAHETAHVRRRDNLWAAVVHAIVSAFWFDPVLWWIERRMLAEREIACDEMALASGADPEHYVAGIAKVCHLSAAGASGYAGATSANLHQRMEHIMNANARPTASRSLRVLAGAWIAIAALLPAGGAFLRAQTPAAPTDPDFQAGLQMLNAKNYDGAYEAFGRSRKANPSGRGLQGMIEVDLAQNRVDDAMALLRPELEAHPDSRELRQMAGNILTRAGRYDEAIRNFQSLLTADSSPAAQADAWLRLGEVCRRKGDDVSAIAALDNARRLAPDNATAVSTLALVYDHAGRREEATQIYREVLRLNPNNGVALNNLAYLIAERGGSLDEALQLAQRAREVLPQTYETGDTLGWVQLKRKEYDAAVAAFAGIVAKSPGTAAYRSHLAMALDERGDSTPAAIELKSLLRADATADNQRRVQELLRSVAQ